jgi:pimeloyl-ACP methyl ester carboxylesterase
MVGTFFKDDDFEYMMLGALGATYHKCADVGECLTTAASIEDGDYEGWYRAWLATADRVRRFAEQSAAKGHQTSAREAFLRASLTYYKNAAFFLDGTSDPSRILPTFKAHRECFDEAASRFDPPVEKVQIPYEDTTLPGYLFKVDGSGRSRPLLLLNNGSDSDAADMYLMGAAAALERGYNALAYDGPGQGAALFLQDLYFRPDWEEVVTPVVDFALGRPEVDPEKIAIMGISLGGYLAPRAASGEHRLAACIADPGLWDMLEAARARFSALPKDVLEKLPDVDPEVLEPIVKHIQETPALRWAIVQRGFWVQGADSLSEYLKLAEDYSLKEVASQIRCPTLLTWAESDPLSWNAELIYERLRSQKELVRFYDAEGAGDHCEAKARPLFNQRAFDWLDETLAAQVPKVDRASGR